MFSVFEEMPLDQMLARVKKYNPGDGYLLVEKAYHFAEKAHAGQKRKSGEPYFIHPFCTIRSKTVTALSSRISGASSATKWLSWWTVSPN